jgi:hypothetical protein
MTLEAMLYVSILGPILGVTVCTALVRKKSWNSLVAVGLLYGLGNYFLSLHEFGLVEGLVRAGFVALLPTVGAWALVKFESRGRGAQ